MAVLVILILIVGASAAYYLVDVAPQPNMIITAVGTPQPVQTPLTQQVQSQGLVSGSGSFSYTATLKGSYNLTFGNSFSTFSSKSISIIYTVRGTQYKTGLSLSPGQTNYVYVGLNPGDSVSGTFSISGGSGNDADFSIVGSTCSEAVPFSFTISNSGSASGFASVAFLANGTSIWTNKYFVPSGQNVPVTGSGNVSDCGPRAFTAVITSQQKG